jgi:hypothetical protein
VLRETPGRRDEDVDALPVAEDGDLLGVKGRLADGGRDADGRAARGGRGGGREARDDAVDLEREVARGQHDERVQRAAAAWMRAARSPP